MSTALLETIHEQYRRAVESARDESLPSETRDKAAADAADLRIKLDRAIIDNSRAAEVGEARSRMDSIIRPNGAPAMTVIEQNLRDFFAEPEPDGPARRQLLLPTQTRADEEWFKDTAKTVKAGYLYSTEVANTVLYHEVIGSGVLLSGPTQINTPHARNITYPFMATDASAAQRTERSAASLTQPVFSNPQLDGYPQAGYMVLTQELTRDAEVNVWEAVSNVAGRAMAEKVATCVATDDGASKPHGLNHAAASGKTAAAKTTFTYDELADLFLSVRAPYRRRGTWRFGSTAYQILFKMKDADGRPYLQPSPAAEMPDTLMGRAVYEDENYPACTTGLTPVDFGDVSAYLFRTCGPIVIERDDSVFFTSFESVVRFQHVMDGELADPGAVKKLTLA